MHLNTANMTADGRALYQALETLNTQLALVREELVKLNDALTKKKNND